MNELFKKIAEEFDTKFEIPQSNAEYSNEAKEQLSFAFESQNAKIANGVNAYNKVTFSRAGAGPGTSNDKTPLAQKAFVELVHKDVAYNKSLKLQNSSALLDIMSEIKMLDLNVSGITLNEYDWESIVTDNLFPETQWFPAKVELSAPDGGKFMGTFFSISIFTSYNVPPGTVIVYAPASYKEFHVEPDKVEEKKEEPTENSDEISIPRTRHTNDGKFCRSKDLESSEGLEDPVCDSLLSDLLEEYAEMLTDKPPIQKVKREGVTLKTKSEAADRIKNVEYKLKHAETTEEKQAILKDFRKHADFSYVNPVVSRGGVPVENHSTAIPNAKTNIDGYINITWDKSSDINWFNNFSVQAEYEKKNDIDFDKTKTENNSDLDIDAVTLAFRNMLEAKINYKKQRKLLKQKYGI